MAKLVVRSRGQQLQPGEPSAEACPLRAQVICWVLGEYGTLAPGGAAAAIDRLVDVAERNALGEEVRGYLLSALGKLHAAGGLALGEGAAQLLADAAASHAVDLQLRALQMQALLQCAAHPRFRL